MSTLNYKIDRGKYRTIYAIGDIHGDFNLLLSLLKYCANVIDDNGKWISSNTCVVLVGDTLDRKRPSIPVRGELDGEEMLIHLYLNQLCVQAKKNNSILIKCLGNHEIMNIDPMYKNVRNNYITKKGQALRKVFPISRGSFFAKQIYTEDTYPFVQIGKYFFVHGGIGPVSYDNKTLLIRAKEAMKKYFCTTETLSAQDLQAQKLVHAMLWDRQFTSRTSCSLNSKKLDKIMKIIDPKIKKVLSGHTVTVYNRADNGTFFDTCEGSSICTVNTTNKSLEKNPNPGIHYSCDEKVVRLDNGASRAFGSDRMPGRLPQVFKIQQSDSGEDKYSVVRYLDYLSTKNKESFDTRVSKTFNTKTIRRTIEQYIQSKKLFAMYT